MGNCFKSGTKPYEGFTFKIGLLGRSSTGKTAIANRFSSNSFNPNYTHTRKNIVAVKSYVLDEANGVMTLELWELQNNLTVPMDAAIITIESTYSIEEIQDIYKDWLYQARKLSIPQVHVAITMSDLGTYTEQDAEKIRSALGMSSDSRVFVISASSNTGITKMMKSVLSALIRKK